MLEGARLCRGRHATLALGIGVNIAVFRVFHAALVETLPVEEPDRLVAVYTWTEKDGDHFDFSYPLYVDLRDGNKLLSGLTAYTSMGVGVSANGRSDRIIAEFVASNYFDVAYRRRFGVYGVVSFTVAERTREVGIRLALGADPRKVLRMVLMSGARIAAAGIVAGLLLSTWLTRIVKTQLYNTSPMDLGALAGASLLLFAIVELAAYLPARRATRIDPIAALRRE